MIFGDEFLEVRIKFRSQFFIFPFQHFACLMGFGDYHLPFAFEDFKCNAVFFCLVLQHQLSDDIMLIYDNCQKKKELFAFCFFILLKYFMRWETFHWSWKFYWYMILFKLWLCLIFWKSRPKPENFCWLSFRRMEDFFLCFHKHLLHSPNFLTFIFSWLLHFVWFETIILIDKLHFLYGWLALML